MHASTVCSKAQRKKLKFYTEDPTCVCESRKTTAHMLQCSQLTHPCSLDDLTTFRCFRCKCYDGTTREGDLAKDLVVDGETCEFGNNFCYLVDTLDGDGGADLDTTVRIRSRLMKFR